MLVATGKSHVNCCNLKRFSRRRDAKERVGTGVGEIGRAKEKDRKRQI